MSRNLTFDATDVNITSRTAAEVTVSVDVNYLDEILCQLSVGDIIDSFDDLDGLYRGLEEHFER